MSDEAIVLVCVGAVLAIGLRSFLWWYWGIGRAIAALESIAVSQHRDQCNEPICETCRRAG